MRARISKTVVGRPPIAGRMVLSPIGRPIFQNLRMPVTMTEPLFVSAPRCDTLGRRLWSDVEIAAIVKQLETHHIGAVAQAWGTKSNVLKDMLRRRKVALPVTQEQRLAYARGGRRPCPWASQARGAPGLCARRPVEQHSEGARRDLYPWTRQAFSRVWCDSSRSEAKWRLFLAVWRSRGARFCVLRRSPVSRPFLLPQAS